MSYEAFLISYALGIHALEAVEIYGEIHFQN